MTTRQAQHLDDLKRLRRVRDTSIVLYPPGADPGVTDDERRTIAEMMAKGTYGIVVLATRLESGGAEIVQEPTDQPYGVRDFAVRDPAGNMVRVQEVR